MFDSLIMSTFLYGIEVWASAYGDNYFSRIMPYVSMHDIIQERDKKLWNNIVANEDHPLFDLLPPKTIRYTSSNRMF